MKIFKNKKALNFAMLLMVVVLICLGFLFWQLNKKTEKFERDVGDMQIGLVLTQQKADNMLFYLDQSAKYSAYQAADMLGQFGGFSPVETSCGSLINNYFPWNTCADPKNICFPDVFKSFKHFFNIKLNNYLGVYKGNLYNTPDFIKDNYMITIHDKKITGTAIKDIETNIAPYQPRGAVYSAGRYSFKPSFSIDFPYDFNKYFDLKKTANAIVSNCAQQFTSSDQRKQCVLNQAPTAKFSGDHAFLDIDTGFTSPYTNQKISIMLALCVPLKPSPPAPSTIQQTMPLPTPSSTTHPP